MSQQKQAPRNDKHPRKVWHRFVQELAVKKKGPRRPSTSATRWTEDDFKTAFDLFDRDHDGTITRGEVKTVLKTLGQKATKEEIDELVGAIDVDGDGTISLGEFKSMMKRLMECNEADDKQFLEDTFHDFDVFGDGYIGVEDLQIVFQKLGDDEITTEEIEQMIVDATGSAERKQVTLKEFKAVSKGF